MEPHNKQILQRRPLKFGGQGPEVRLFLINCGTKHLAKCQIFICATRTKLNIFLDSRQRRGL